MNDDRPNSLVTIYAVFENRDWRGRAVIVGPRQLLTCQHLVTGLYRDKPADGRFLHVLVDDYPRRMGRASLERLVPAHEVTGHNGLAVDMADGEGFALLRFEPDGYAAERTRPFERWRATKAAGPGATPAKILLACGFVGWPAETRRGDSGSPVFTEYSQLCGLHTGKNRYVAVTEGALSGLEASE